MALTSKKDYGKEERKAEWAHAQRTMHGLDPSDSKSMIEKAIERASYTELSEIAEQAKQHAEIAR